MSNNLKPPLKTISSAHRSIAEKFLFHISGGDDGVQVWIARPQWSHVLPRVEAVNGCLHFGQLGIPRRYGATLLDNVDFQYKNDQSSMKEWMGRDIFGAQEDASIASIFKSPLPFFTLLPPLTYLRANWVGRFSLLFYIIIQANNYAAHISAYMLWRRSTSNINNSRSPFEYMNWSLFTANPFHVNSGLSISCCSTQSACDRIQAIHIPIWSKNLSTLAITAVSGTVYGWERRNKKKTRGDQGMVFRHPLVFG